MGAQSGKQIFDAQTTQCSAKDFSRVLPAEPTRFHSAPGGPQRATPQHLRPGPVPATSSARWPGELPDPYIPSLNLGCISGSSSSSSLSGWSTARSRLSTDGETSGDHHASSSGGERSWPSTDWEFLIHPGAMNVAVDALGGVTPSCASPPLGMQPHLPDQYASLRMQPLGNQEIHSAVSPPLPVRSQSALLPAFVRATIPQVPYCGRGSQVPKAYEAIPAALPVPEVAGAWRNDGNLFPVSLAATAGYSVLDAPASRSCLAHDGVDDDGDAHSITTIGFDSEGVWPTSVCEDLRLDSLCPASPMTTPQKEPEVAEKFSYEATDLINSGFHQFSFLDDGELAEDDGQYSLDDCTTVASTTCVRKKPTRRGGKRAKGRPCHKRGLLEYTRGTGSSKTQEVTSASVVEDKVREDSPGVGEHKNEPMRSFYPLQTEFDESVSQDACSSSRRPTRVLSRSEFPKDDQAVVPFQGMGESGRHLAKSRSSGLNVADRWDCGPPFASRRLSEKHLQLADPCNLWKANSELSVPSEMAASSSMLSSLNTVDEEEDDIVGKRALLTGLRKIGAFNGQWGKIVAYDADTHRYMVQVFVASGVPVRAKLRRENLIIPRTVALRFADDDAQEIHVDDEFTDSDSSEQVDFSPYPNTGFAAANANVYNQNAAVLQGVENSFSNPSIHKHGLPRPSEETTFKSTVSRDVAPTAVPARFKQFAAPEFAAPDSRRSNQTSTNGSTAPSIAAHSAQRAVGPSLAQVSGSAGVAVSTAQWRPSLRRSQ